MIQEIEFVSQRCSYDCGPSVMKMIADYYGLDYSVSELIGLCKTTTIGTSILNLQRCAKEIGLRTFSTKCQLSDLQMVPLPAIALLNSNHYVVISEINYNHIRILDPRQGVKHYTYSRFIHKWYEKETEKGIIILFEKT